MADRTPPPKRDFSWGKISKTLSLWIIVILIPIVFMQVNGARDQTTEIDYSTYSQQLDADNVQKIQLVFLANCRDPTTTAYQVQRFFDWIDQVGEGPMLVRRAASRARIVRAISSELTMAEHA